MSDFFAALPMYDWPENRAEVDAEWAALRAGLVAAGIDAPERLVRRNGDLPAVPGGIRDEAGNVIAPDPATLPPDDLDFPTLWRHPKLLFGQACWGPMELGLAKQVRVVGQPDYSMFEGGEGALYSSAIVMRWDEEPPSVLPRIPLNLIRNKRLAFNSDDSMSGIIALTRELAALGESTRHLLRTHRKRRTSRLHRRGRGGQGGRGGDRLPQLGACAAFRAGSTARRGCRLDPAAHGPAIYCGPELAGDAAARLTALSVALIRVACR